MRIKILGKVYLNLYWTMGLLPPLKPKQKPLMYADSGLSHVGVWGLVFSALWPSV